MELISPLFYGRYGGAEWVHSSARVGYGDALAYMERHIALMHGGQAGEQIWLLEHPPLITMGTSASADEVDSGVAIPVYHTGRGGRTTWHGPGQRVAYVMLDLRLRGRDVKRFVWRLEEWLIGALARLGVCGERRAGRVGIWVVRDGEEMKIAALGIRLRRWISFHGVSVNLAPDLASYDSIKPCGITDYGVTSLEALGVQAGMSALDDALAQSFEEVFGGSLNQT